MQKPYRGDYKPDYEKWKTNKESFFVIYLGMSFFAFIIGIFFDFRFDWSPFGIKFHICCLIATILYYIFVENPNYDRKVKESRIKSENEAERRYQEDMDRYEHYWATKYEEAIRQANIDATVRGISNEELLGIYVRLAEINNQVNERNFALFNQARQALESRNTYSIDDALNQFRQKFLG